MNDIPRRAQKILHAVVTEYLACGEAVGSRTITRRHDLGLSPATVRNVMADLEELGLLEQRHTSAGRVPTATGLRFFIDSLLKVRGLSAREKEEIRERVAAPTPDEVVNRASQILSDLTQHAAVIIAPDPDQQRLERIEFVPLRDGKLIAILVTTDGRIENRLVIDEPGLTGRGSGAEGRRGLIDEPGLTGRGSGAEGRRGLIDEAGLTGRGSGAEGRRGLIDEAGLTGRGSGAEGRRGLIDEPGLTGRGSGAEGRRGLIDEPGLTGRGSGAEGRRGLIDEVQAASLDRIHNYLNDQLAGKTLDEVREHVIRKLGDDKNRYDDAVSAALRLGHAVFVSTPERIAPVVVSGQLNLIDAETAGERARDLLRALEDKQTLIRLLDRTRHAVGLQVFLGAETAMSALAGNSVVAMPYGPDERPIGALAVIGPMRMNYGKVMSVVDVTAETVSRLLAELGGNGS